MDWLAMALSMTATILIGYKRRIGWLVGVAASAAWMAYGIAQQSLAMAIVNVVYISNAVVAYRRWREKP